MERMIVQLPTRMPVKQELLRVAAYARVSTGKDAMLHSLSNQVSHYSKLIQDNPAWTFVKVYVDEAETGTTEARAGFQEMLGDCRAGKLDMVIVKSISRFSRNTVILLESVRELKWLGVNVYFEEQNIFSISAAGELLITLMAAYAQEESRNASENVKWRIRNGFRAGELMGFHFMYGYTIRKGQIEINPEQARVIRKIFEDYTSGVDVYEIALQLRRQGIPCYRNGEWTPERVRKLLKNEKYAGNALLQKTFIADHLTKHQRRNRGELAQYYVEGSHPAIIENELYEAACKRREANRQANNIAKKPPIPTAFTGMIVCGRCGKHYKRKTNHARIIWHCSTYLIYGKAHCPARQVPEAILMMLTADVLGLTAFSEGTMREQLTRIEVPEQHRLVYAFKDGRKVERTWAPTSRKDSWDEAGRERARAHANRRYANE